MDTEIAWYGHSCFQLTERKLATVVTDPYDHHVVGYKPLKLKADIVTISRDLPGHNHLSVVKGTPYPVTGPGEYEIGGVFITGVQTNGQSKKNKDELINTMFVIDFNGLTIAHLGEMNRVPNQTEVEDLGSVHVALVPVGGGDSLNAAKAAGVISLLEPSIVIPMYYATDDAAVKLDSLAKFLKEMGLSGVEPQDSLKIGGITNLPEETKVVVLKSQHG